MMDTALTFPLAFGTTIIYGATLPSTERRNGRREAEQRAVAMLVSNCFGNRFALRHDNDGAPFLSPTDGAPYISISHGAGYALLAVDSDSRIGVDIESPRPTLSRIAPRFMTADEMFVHGRTTASILRAWTAKEAIFKALGRPQLTVGDIHLPDIPDCGSIEVLGRRISLDFIEQDTFTIALARLI